MKDLSKYIGNMLLEGDNINIDSLYRVSIAKENDNDEYIGKVEKLTFAFQMGSECTFMRRLNGIRKHAIDIDPKYLQSEQTIQQFCDECNEYKFWRYFPASKEKEALKLAEKVSREKKSTKWTLKKLYNEIQNFKPLMNLERELGYDYRITSTHQQNDKTSYDCILVSSSIRLRVNGSEIIIDKAGTDSRVVYNIPSLYQVLCNKPYKNGSVSSRIQTYSKLYKN